MTEVQGETALGVSLQIQLSPTRQVVFQTHVAQVTTADELNKLLDKLNGVGDRAEIYYQIPVLEAEHKRAVQILEDHTRRMENVESNARAKYEEGGRRGIYKPAAADTAAKIQAEDQLKIAKRMVDETMERLEKARKEAGTRDGSATDRPAGVPDR